MSKLRVFVSYSHKDGKWVDKDSAFSLIPWLAESLHRDGVDFWYDPELKRLPGEEYKKKINNEIGSAHISILLLSQNFANSDFIHDFELPEIKKRIDAGELLVIPIMVGPVNLQAEEHLKWLADRQILPGKPTPLINYTRDRAEFERVLAELLQAVRHRVNQIKTKWEHTGAETPKSGTGLVNAAERPMTMRTGGDEKKPPREAGLWLRILGLSRPLKLAILIVLLGLVIWPAVWVAGHRNRPEVPASGVAQKSRQAGEVEEPMPMPLESEASGRSGKVLDPSRLATLRSSLTEYLEKREFGKIEETAEEILELAPDDPGAIDAQAIIDQRKGLGEIGRFECSSIVLGAAFSADDRGVVAFSKGIVSHDPVKQKAAINLWDPQRASAPQIVRLDINNAQAVAFSSNRGLLAGGTLGGIIVYDVTTGRRLGLLEAGWVDDLVFMPGDGKVLSARGTNLEVWDLELKISTRRYAGPQSRIRRLALSPDGRWAVSISKDGVACLHDLQEQSTGWSVNCGVLTLRGICISPDGTTVLIGAPEGVRMLDLATGTEVRRFNDFGNLSIAVSPDGKRAVSGGAKDNFVRVWSLKDGTRIRTYKVREGCWIGTVAFSSNGESVLAAADQRIHVWALPK